MPAIDAMSQTGAATPATEPNRFDNFLAFASNPKGTLTDSFAKGWSKGVAANTAEAGSKLSLIDTLGAGVSGGAGGVKDTITNF